ncbi:hypothetical protein BDF20DRAFT_829300 [Mycotypha africana]|uniref:uncharacterized protein n=1 Tax=Mycotypha africana TaxID=64632 RepID=UPI0023019F2A|nr:uncharacterized protein BDF20DRAFT_829300 [Mycotypha africana]KAI8967565.1 hypothetical protein BDF20DRAFT_829300 [Mycotypha africana]
MRRAYQRAVTIPLNNIEHLWKEYDQWENTLNRLTAKKFLGETSSAYMTARTALREMRLYTEKISINVAAVPPTWTSNEIAQLDAWKKYIDWEKKNPLQLEDETAVMDRVAYAYQQAFFPLRFYPELWYDLANYYLEHNKPEKALSILKQSIEIMPTSLLLNLFYSELCESRKQLDDARETYEQLISSLDKEIEEIREKAQAEIAKLEKQAEEERASMNLSDDIDGELREQLRTREKRIKKEQEARKKDSDEKIEVLARGGSLVWINYMRFARRTDGIKSARALFSRARKATNCTYHVYVADALMEYHNSKDATIAGKVFSLGQKTYADNADFVCQYLDFLIQMNDDNNTRALFERTLATMPAESADPIWRKFLDYETKYGDLASVQNVEKRRIEAMNDPNINTMESFLKRQSYMDIRNIEHYELGLLAREQLKSESASTAVSKANEPHQQAQQSQLGAQQSLHEHRTHEQHKRPLLDSVYPERFPRPDLGQWQSYKPAPRPVNASPIITTVISAPVPEIQPSPQTSHQGPIQTEPVVRQQTSIPAQPAPLPMIHQHHSPRMTAPPVPQQNALPDAVAYFVSNLPPPQTFNGPLIQAVEIVELLRSIVLPLPPNQSQPQTAPMPFSAQQQPTSQQRPMGGLGGKGPMHPGGGRDGNRGGQFGNRGGGAGGAGNRSGYGKARGGNNNMRNAGGGKGMKRRGRDDFDDDYQSPKGKKKSFTITVRRPH